MLLAFKSIISRIVPEAGLLSFALASPHPPSLSPPSAHLFLFCFTCIVIPELEDNAHSCLLYTSDAADEERLV